MKTPYWFTKKNWLAILLLPISWLYLIVSKIVFYFRKINQATSPLPVICVGGVLAGGVGKTPIVKELALKIPNAAVVMRGYKGGDEAHMLADNGITVFVGSDRLFSIKKAKEAGFSCVIMDDGFQNPSVKKDFSILVFDGGILGGNGFILPAGPLREPMSDALKRANAIIIITKNNAVHGAELLPKNIVIAQSHTKTNHLRGKYIAFAGIGYPKKFFDAVREKINLVETISFPDHYEYKNSDEEKLIKLAKKHNAKLLTTEKDFVRLSLRLKKITKVAPQQVDVPQSLVDQIIEVVNDNPGKRR